MSYIWYDGQYADAIFIRTSAISHCGQSWSSGSALSSVEGSILLWGKFHKNRKRFKTPSFELISFYFICKSSLMY